MKDAERVYEMMGQAFYLERNQGLDYEVRERLPPGWAVELRRDGYLFHAPWSSDWETLVWEMVRFLAYKSFIILRKKGSGDSIIYELLSGKDNGVGFRAVFSCD